MDHLFSYCKHNLMVSIGFIKAIVVMIQSLCQIGYIPCCLQL